MPGSLIDLAEYVESRAGDALRCVATYDGHNYELLRVRDDLKNSNIEKRAEEVHSNITSRGRRRESRLCEDLGDIQASLQMRKNAVILHFPLDEDEGAIVSLEPEAARDLGMFVQDCLRHL